MQKVGKSIPKNGIHKVLSGLLWGWRGVPGVVMKEEAEKAGWGVR